MKEKRQKRLNSELKKLIYECLTKQIKNPNITEIFSVTGVEVTNDLEEATVYISVFSTDELKKKMTFDGIVDSAFEVRKCLAKMMRIRTVPKINFRQDNSLEYGNKIDKILDGLTYGDNNDNK